MTSEQSSATKRRRDADVAKLMKLKYDVTFPDDSLTNFRVKFHGPRDTPYEGGVWIVEVVLPDQYPFKPPTIRFVNKIFHPNVCEPTGTVCLNVIHDAWTALYDLSNIFESFLPQLLTYPNPSHPLNLEAALLCYQTPAGFIAKVKEYVTNYAVEEVVNVCEKLLKGQNASEIPAEKTESNGDSSVSDMSDSDGNDN